LVVGPGPRGVEATIAAITSPETELLDRDDSEHWTAVLRARLITKFLKKVVGELCLLHQLCIGKKVCIQSLLQCRF
jgi:hypothetical protein